MADPAQSSNSDTHKFGYSYILVQVIYKRREKKHERDSTSFFMYNHSINNNIYNIGKCEV